MAAKLNCKIATKLLLEAGERALTPAEVESLTFHVERCLSCNTYRDQLGFLRRALKRYAETGPNK